VWGTWATAFSSYVADEPRRRLVEAKEMDAPASVVISLNPIKEPNMVVFCQMAVNSEAVATDDEPVGPECPHTSLDHSREG